MRTFLRPTKQNFSHCLVLFHIKSKYLVDSDAVLKEHSTYLKLSKMTRFEMYNECQSNVVHSVLNFEKDTFNRMKLGAVIIF